MPRRGRLRLGRPGADDRDQVRAGRDGGRRPRRRRRGPEHGQGDLRRGHPGRRPAGTAGERKKGHAYFFPATFSDRAGAYFAKYGREKTRRAFARWYRNAIENARLCDTAQEYHNTCPDLEAAGARPSPTRESFVDHLNVFDCSKVSDGAAAIAVVSEEGLKRIGDRQVRRRRDRRLGPGRSRPDRPARGPDAARDHGPGGREGPRLRRHHRSPISGRSSATTASRSPGVLSVEAIGLAEPGEGPDYILDGHTVPARAPCRSTRPGGLIGWGHPTGGTGVRQAVTIWQQLTGQGRQLADRDSRRAGPTGCRSTWAATTRRSWPSSTAGRTDAERGSAMAGQAAPRSRTAARPPRRSRKAGRAGRRAGAHREAARRGQAHRPGTARAPPRPGILRRARQAQDPPLLRFRHGRREDPRRRRRHRLRPDRRPAGLRLRPGLHRLRRLALAEPTPRRSARSWTWPWRTAPRSSA